MQGPRIATTSFARALLLVAALAGCALPRSGPTVGEITRGGNDPALEVRYGPNIPIFADEAVLDEAGVLFEADEEEQEVEQFREFLDQVTPEDFAQ